MSVEFRYASGELVGLGDAVRIDSSATGMVVGVVHEGLYSGSHTKDHWDQYRAGVLVESREFGLILYEDAQDFAKLSKIV